LNQIRRGVRGEPWFPCSLLEEKKIEIEIEIVIVIVKVRVRGIIK